MSVGTRYNSSVLVEVACSEWFSGKTDRGIKPRTNSSVGQLYVSSGCARTTVFGSFNICRHNSFKQNYLLT
jgi:hypothetical protein